MQALIRRGWMMICAQRAADDRAGGIWSALGNPDASQASGSVLRVLLVEDDDIDAKLVTLCASGIAGFRLDIERAISSTEALTRMATRRFDLCIADFWLGCESSVRFLADLGGSGPRTPVMVLTSLSTPDIRQMCLQAGAAAFLGKAELTAQALEDAVMRTIAAAATCTGADLHAAQPDLGPSLPKIDALHTMTETVRYGMFEAFWAEQPARSHGCPDGRIDLRDLVRRAVEITGAELQQRKQSVSYKTPAVHVTSDGDAASLFFLVFEFLMRASRLSAENSMLHVDIATDDRAVNILFHSDARVDWTAGASVLGPLCAQILTDQKATFSDTSDAGAGFVLALRLPRTGERQRTHGATPWVRPIDNQLGGSS